MDAVNIYALTSDTLLRSAQYNLLHCTMKLTELWFRRLPGHSTGSMPCVAQYSFQSAASQVDICSRTIVSAAEHSPVQLLSYENRKTRNTHLASSRIADLTGVNARKVKDVRCRTRLRDEGHADILVLNSSLALSASRRFRVQAA